MARKLEVSVVRTVVGALREALVLFLEFRATLVLAWGEDSTGLALSAAGGGNKHWFMLGGEVTLALRVQSGWDLRGWDEDDEVAVSRFRKELGR